MTVLARVLVLTNTVFVKYLGAYSRTRYGFFCHFLNQADTNKTNGKLANLGTWRQEGGEHPFSATSVFPLLSQFLQIAFFFFQFNVTTTVYWQQDFSALEC